MTIQVKLQDHTGLVTRQARIAENASVARLIPALVSQLALPVVAGERPIYYHLSHKNRILADDETLASAGVADGDTLTIAPEMIAACFPPGTLIAGPDNTQLPIEDVRPGDPVTSLDARTRELFVGTVAERLVTSAQDFVLVNGRLKVTPSHFVFADESWQRAGALKPGQHLLALDGTRPLIEKLERLQPGPSKVYNLHLGNPEHTFFADDILVHNSVRKMVSDEFDETVRESSKRGVSYPLRQTAQELRLADEDRKKLIEEIAEVLDARFLVRIVNERKATEKEREEAQGSLVVRPVFGMPGTDGQYECDVFMIMPFVEEFQSIYMDYVKPVIESFGLVVKRGDDFFSDRTIIDDIWSGIARCRLVVADCTGRNVNVFYELGLAHAIGKSTILITQQVSDLPFDLQGRRAIVYADNSRGLKNLEKQLRESISALNLTASE